LQLTTMEIKSQLVNDKISRLDRIVYYRLFFIIVAIAATMDRLTKWLVQIYLPYGTYDEASMVEVIPHFFYICHIGNTGAAWGMFHGQSFFLAIFSGVALALLYFFRKGLGLRNINVQLTLGLVSGGILGNLYDRLAYNHVVDFLDFHLGFYRWPAFNVADSCILIGVLLFSWFSFQEEAARKSSKA
jgi:signal peptidase II